MPGSEARTANGKRRNGKIRERVEALRGEGWSIKEALWIVAEEFDLSWATVRDIVYDRRRK